MEIAWIRGETNGPPRPSPAARPRRARDWRDRRMMMADTMANARHPIHELIAERTSSRAFGGADV
jgi:hypothetical protein